MSKQKKNDKQKVKNLMDAIERRVQKEEKCITKIYTLDDENAIVVNFLPGGPKNVWYTMTHYKMIYSTLYDVTPYPMNGTHGKQLKNYKLFMIMKNNRDYDNRCVSIYDYDNSKFIVEPGTFDNIGYDASMSIIDQYTPCTDYLKRYNCFLAYFTLTSLDDNNERLQYTSLINGQRYWYSFEPPKETYFALVNLDGTIRGNSLFKGDNLTKIEQVIDLRQYGSLEEFKKQRRTELTQIKKKNQKAYYDKVGTGHWENPSPYLDEEVIKVMSLSK